MTSAFVALAWFDLCIYIFDLPSGTPMFVEANIANTSYTLIKVNLTPSTNSSRNKDLLVLVTNKILFTKTAFVGGIDPNSQA